MPKRNQIEDVFTYIDTKDGDQTQCWPWQGTMGSRHRDRGYFSIDGKKYIVHRLVWELFNGPIPEGLVVRHKCDNSICCNPNHMELGTQSDNERDKYRRDRAGLPVQVVREIRRMLELSNVSKTAIAKDVSSRFGIAVSRESVSKISLGKRRYDGDEKTIEEIFLERTRDAQDRSAGIRVTEDSEEATDILGGEEENIE